MERSTMSAPMHTPIVSPTRTSFEQDPPEVVEVQLPCRQAADN